MYSLRITNISASVIRFCFVSFRLGWIFFSISFSVQNGLAQDNAGYLKSHAVPVTDPYRPGDSVYALLSPYRIIMVGEMHGSEESAQLVTGLASLFARHGDSVSVGLEIPPEQMAGFSLSRTDSSLYQCDFFSKYEPFDGRESFAWASVISHLKNNKHVDLFFFDLNADELNRYDRDSMMSAKIKQQIDKHPGWKLITLSGNAHARMGPGEKQMAEYLADDMERNASHSVCSIVHYFQKGSCYGNFGGVFQERHFDRPLNEWGTATGHEKYLVKTTANSSFPYTFVYYTQNISPSPMVKGNLDLPAIKKELKTIYDRDQKTRKGIDSAEFVMYIDSCNQVQVKAIIEKYGWMGTSFIGGLNTVLFLVIQHADSAVQEEYFPLLRQSVEEGESRISDMALMQDRILMRRGKQQVYGSQVVFDPQGKPKFYPIEDEKNVNARRAQAGLQPIEEYAKYFGIDYHPVAE